MPYGAPDLLAARHPHLALALTTASLMAVMLFAAALQIAPFFRTPAPIAGDFSNFIDPAPDFHPISVKEPPPPVVPVRSRARVDEGLVIPVPPSEAPPLEPPAAGGRTGGETIGSGLDLSGSLEGRGRTEVEPVPVRGIWTPVDELPVEIREFKPEYPEIARQAGVEGLVIVHAMIGKDGRVMRVELDETRSIPLLNEAALEAAKRWVFKPAITNGRPVVVWFAIPFHFVLHE